ncbi:MAG: hypothetical protein EBW05_05280 [Betaproteobacteria bacterium]|nr:hypothetical protein [Betaproteobacteria bacterium]
MLKSIRFITDGCKRAAEALLKGNRKFTIAAPGDVDLALAARWQWDSALHWQQKLPQLRLRWTLAATNLFDRADWREAPTQSWGGTYLFPVQARSLRMALQAHW